jgi:hypothetical protein
MKEGVYRKIWSWRKIIRRRKHSEEEEQQEGRTGDKEENRRVGRRSRTIEVRRTAAWRKRRLLRKR